MYDINQVRADFPILSRKVYDKPLVYLDNAATTQKPLCVLDAMRDEYLNVNANVHRGVHYLSQQATDLHEAARETVRKFINAPKVEEVIFTRGTTESLNLVVSSFCDAFMSEGDEVIISTMEHHSNIVPWQLQAAKKGIAIRVIPINDKGEINLDEFANLFTERTKIVSIAQVSNVLGTVNPVKEMIKIAHEHDVPVMVDGAAGVGQPEQAAPLLVELAVVDIVRLAAELCLFALFCREHTLFDQLIQTDEIGVASKGGKALIRAVAVAGHTQRQDLPVGLPGVLQPVYKIVCFLRKAADAVGGRQTADGQ
jgi:DNA-binding transcriptional MocR family regulator